jgi:hypothetical protein
MTYGLRRSLAIGSVFEIVVFVVSIPRDSTQPETGVQMLAAYTQVPGMVAFFRVTDLANGLPAGVAVPLMLLMLIVAFLIQAVLFALPAWCLARWWRTVARPPIGGA